MNSISTSAFSEIVVTSLIGASVRETKCGSGTGSIVNLHLNGSTGLLYLMIFCSWKILQQETVTCSWRDPESTIKTAFSAMKDLRVLNAHLAPGGDLGIELETGVWIYLFSDSAFPEEVEIESDYFVEVGATIYTCLRGRFYVEEAAVHCK
jgi:hypothetical protein